MALLLIGLWSYGYFFREQRVETGNAQLRTVTLYDGSLVTLNANSQLRIPSRFAWLTDRQVWINGEAFFAVQKVHDDETGHYRKFTVHTRRADVAVLGTRFTVYSRPQRTQIVLEEGRVELTDPATRQLLTMKPGQLVAYVGKQAGQLTAC